MRKKSRRLGNDTVSNEATLKRYGKCLRKCKRKPHVGPCVDACLEAEPLAGLGATKAEKALDKEIESIYYRHGSGVHISVMDIGKIFRAGRDAHARGEPMEPAIVAAIQAHRVNGLGGSPEYHARSAQTWTSHAIDEATSGASDALAKGQCARALQSLVRAERKTTMASENAVQSDDARLREKARQ